jgi:hypothetical protein
MGLFIQPPPSTPPEVHTQAAAAFSLAAAPTAAKAERTSLRELHELRRLMKLPADADLLPHLAGEPPGAAVELLVRGRFAGDAFSHQELREITAEAYGDFTHAAVAPLRQLDSGLWILELFHGPTLAFKDVAMQLLSRLYERVLTAKKRTLTIVCGNVPSFARFST